ncbi:hypothetical protein T265_02987 [Opisthorchis viverrini]|uniref:Uncharacterized protein n=1 Tax=Opisthorchis viverrini TaxID=6198 RepID=A0A074ZT99_OPIVI|nr:hypothetical protein T265_02987 [Opisthorchis viverrini]KER30638.1 hypothetical protein T265_02987 [Opisthorchis viverrini]
MASAALFSKEMESDSQLTKLSAVSNAVAKAYEHSSRPGAVILVSPHRKEKNWTRAHQQCTSVVLLGLNFKHLTCEASVLPLHHKRALDGSEFSHLNRRALLRDVIGLFHVSNDDPMTGSPDCVDLLTHTTGLRSQLVTGTIFEFPKSRKCIQLVHM